MRDSEETRAALHWEYTQLAEAEKYDDIATRVINIVRKVKNPAHTNDEAIPSSSLLGVSMYVSSMLRTSGRPLADVVDDLINLQFTITTPPPPDLSPTMDDFRKYLLGV